MDKKEFPKTDYMCEGLRLTILGCFRYSLGRMTYMPSHTCYMITEHPEIFTKQDWQRFIDEIDECPNLGMECDKQTWAGLKKFALHQLSYSKDGLGEQK